jgi:hypothetical protein
MHNVSRLSALLFSASLLMLGCGSDSDGTGPDESEGDLDAGTARVTIGSTTWTATAIACANFGSAAGFVGQADSDPTISITLDAIPSDPASNSARVDVSDNVSWRAGAAHVDIGATIPAVTASNGYGTGSATFVNTLDPDGFSSGVYETASGDYEFRCP